MAATEHGTVTEGCCFTSLFCESAEQKAERPRKTRRFVVFVAALTFLTANDIKRSIKTLLLPAFDAISKLFIVQI